MDRLLEGIYFLKRKQKALQGILDIKYAELKSELQAAGLKRYSHTVEEESVTASLKTRTRLTVQDVEALVEQVPDPRVLAAAVLGNVAIPKKCVQALNGIGVDTAESISAKKSAPYLEVKCGEGADAKMREQQIEYYAELQHFCDELRIGRTSEEAAKLATLSPLFSLREEEASDATEVLE